MSNLRDRLQLAFDIGTGGTKAALLDQAGEIVVSSFAGHGEILRSEPGFAEQDPLVWWEAVVMATRELTAADRRRLSAIVLTGQMQNLTLVDESGVPLRPTVLYSDLRAGHEAQEIVERLGVPELRRLTGNDQGAGGLLAKLLWLSRHEPDACEQAHHLFLGAADFITHRLTGAAVCDSTTASTTGLLDIVTRRPLPAGLLRQLGLDWATPLLPIVQEGGRLAGELSGEGALALGLAPGTPVYLAPGDAGAATIGAGSGEIGPASGYIGSSGWVSLSAPERADPDSGAITLAHPHRERFIQVAPLLTAGGNLRWVRDLFSAGAYGDSFDSVVEQALAAEAGKLLFLPYLAGERSPINDPFARGVLIGLEPRTGKADLYRAVLEGIAYGFRHALRALVPAGVERLVLTGGGTKSPGWCQLFATILGVDVIVDEAAEHVGLRGAHAAMRVALGESKDYRLHTAGSTFRPDSRYRQRYDDMFERYLELYPALKGVFARLADLPADAAGSSTGSTDR